jgi:polysaccharide biosynthesis/export protein
MTPARLKMALRDVSMTRRMTGTAILFCAGLSLVGCMPDSDLAMLPPPTDTGYRLGVGDQVRVITFDQTQLTNTFTVGEDGTIAFPLVGTLQAANLTANRLAATIAQALITKNLMQNPSVSVEVVQYRPISVLGEVNHPGQYPFQPGMTMLGAVALAGGFTYRAVTSYARDVRTLNPEGPDGSSATVTGRITADSRLEAGDVVTILERYF